MNVAENFQLEEADDLVDLDDSYYSDDTDDDSLWETITDTDTDVEIQAIVSNNESGYANEMTQQFNNMTL